ncbi:signal peptidase I [Vibrio fluvialis]|uniref:signal peptidase I n=1 Tax=Vibrio fluvialis TaxID=676 RepID=UPI0028F74883|nr:signal peptidase I [Vibrio fluvialis]
MYVCIFTFLSIFFFYIFLFLSPLFFNKKYKRTKLLNVISIVFVITYYLIPPEIDFAKNYGESMLPTIKNDEEIVMIKMNDNVSIENDKIYSFMYENECYIKRLFASPGDYVIFKNKYICRNDGKCIYDSSLPDDLNSRLFVKNESYFFLGDNINNSYDSRRFKDIFVDKKTLLINIFLV